MKKKHVEIKPFTWIHRAASLICRCDLDIHIFESGRAVVIAADREDNSSMGVQDGAIYIAESILGKYGFPPEDMIWIERRPEEGASNGEAAYDRVEFTFSGDSPSAPVRSPMDEKELNELIQSIQAE